MASDLPCIYRNIESERDDDFRFHVKAIRDSSKLHEVKSNSVALLCSLPTCDLLLSTDAQRVSLLEIELDRKPRLTPTEPICTAHSNVDRSQLSSSQRPCCEGVEEHRNTRHIKLIHSTLYEQFLTPEQNLRFRERITASL